MNIIVLSSSPSKEFVLKKLMARKTVPKVGKAQVKITFIIIYYVLVGVMGLVTFTYYRASSTYRETIVEYILCEISGMQDCILDLGVIYDIISALTTTVIMMISLLPVMAILFSCNPQACKKKTLADKRANFVRSSTATSQI